MKNIPVLVVLAVLSFSAPAGAADDLSRLGPELLINTTTRGSQLAAAVASDRLGNFVVVWLGADAVGRLQVFGQRFDAAGVRRGGELQISSGNGVIGIPPQVATDPQGGFVVAWTSQGARIRLFDANGIPQGEEIQVDTPQQPELAVDVAVNGAGEVLVLWSTGGLDGSISTRRYDLQGHPLSEPLPLRTHRDLTGVSLALATAPDGDVLAFWSERLVPGSSEIWVRRFDGASQSWGDALLVEPPSGLEVKFALAPAVRQDGSFLLTWTESPGVFTGTLISPEVHARSFALDGRPLEAQSVTLFRIFGTRSGVALDRDGNALVLGSDGQEVFGRLFDRTWRPLTDRLHPHPAELTAKLDPALAADPWGNFFAVWTSGLNGLEAPFAGSDGDSSGIFGQRLGNPRCAPGAETLCLGAGGRFEVKVSWTKPTGETGAGHSRPLTTDTGALWFFGPDNLELLIKVLDARPVNGHFWVYYGALSNVEYTITVTDTQTGQQQTYQNPAGQFLSRADNSAFADDGKSISGTAPTPVPLSTTDCDASEESLCLAQGRFQVQVDFTDPRTGAAGHGQVVPLTADTGAFWFFGPENLELMIKVLDARPVNGKFWVFFGALSDVAYTITVTDTETGQQRTYRNDRGHLASRADVAAFPVTGN